MAPTQPRIQRLFERWEGERALEVELRNFSGFPAWDYLRIIPELPEQELGVDGHGVERLESLHDWRHPLSNCAESCGGRVERRFAIFQGQACLIKKPKSRLRSCGGRVERRFVIFQGKACLIKKPKSRLTKDEGRRDRQSFVQSLDYQTRLTLLKSALSRRWRWCSEWSITFV